MVGQLHRLAFLFLVFGLTTVGAGAEEPAAPASVPAETAATEEVEAKPPAGEPIPAGPLLRVEGPEDYGALLDSMLSGWVTEETPGCALGVIQKGETVLARGYGRADLDHGVPISVSTVFPVGELAKQFTAFAVLLLEAEGKLSLDDEVRTYLPAFPAYERPVLLRHLLYHTSGVRDYPALLDLAGLRDGEFVPRSEILDLLSRQQALNFLSGTDHLYSNSGYVLLGRVVEAASGVPLQSYAAEHIFAPLGMTATRFLEDAREVVPGRAVGYVPQVAGGFAIRLSRRAAVGDGGLYTTVEDLLRWDRNFTTPKVGTTALLARLQTPGTLDDGTPVSYAGGLEVEDYQGVRKIGHGGAVGGYRAAMIRFPDEKLSVTCLCNRADAPASRVASTLADAFLIDVLLADQMRALEAGEPVPDAGPALVPLSPAALEAFAGTYLAQGSGRTITIAVVGDRLVATSYSGSRIPFAPVAAQRFITHGVPIEGTLAFSLATDETPLEASLHLASWGKPQRYQRIEPVTPTPEVMQRFAGIYRCDELRTTFHIEADNVALRLLQESLNRTSPEEPFLPTVADSFAGGGVSLRFLRDETQQITGLRLSNDRLRDIICQREKM